MKAVHILLLTLFTSMVFASCKTTEANYRAAYEKTIAARDSSESIDDTIYGKERRQKNTNTVESAHGNVEVTTQLVKMTKDGGGTPENLRR